MADPFRHHPRLRPLIRDAETSYFRTFDVEAMRADFLARGVPADAISPEETREAGRRALLDRQPPGDLWVFAYGSLMWDPAIRFTEVRRARVPDHARRFILRDVWGGRGDAERPGLMVALDRVPGAACEGLAFRIAEEAVEEETYILWRRERIGPTYLEDLVPAETAQGPVEAVAFVADHETDAICPDLTFEEQVTYAATGTGFLGSSLDYLRGIATQFAALGIADDEVTRLLAAAEARAAGMAVSPAAAETGR